MRTTPRRWTVFAVYFVLTATADSDHLVTAMLAQDEYYGVLQTI